MRLCCLTWVFVLSVALPATANQAEGAPRPAPRSPEGWVVEQVAGPEQVTFPMFGCFDDRGRLYVSESSGGDLYAELREGRKTGKIKLLQDADGDGRFETATLFADRLALCMGLAWRGDKLYAADPPDLITLHGPDASGTAGPRERILTGFGHTDNGSLHGLTFGPDGMLYMTMGEPDGYRLGFPGGTFLEGHSGALIRCRPDGSGVEVVSRGFVNLVEVAFTDTGEAFGTDNWFQQPADGFRDAIVHLVDGGLYPYIADDGSPKPITGVELPPAGRFPAAALSGLVSYQGIGFDDEFRGHLFSAQHNTRKVMRHVPVRAGSSIKTQDFDFLTSDDPDFHPSDVLEDADGSLLVIDTGGWYVEHCPTGKIRDSRAPGGIWRVRRKDAPAVDAPWGWRAANWHGGAALKTSRLIELLADNRPAVRDRARAKLIERGTEAVPELAALINRRDGGAAGPRVAAVWTLAAMADEDPVLANHALREALRANHPHVVIAAARALGHRRDQGAARIMEKLLSADHAPVRFAAAEALAGCGTRTSAAVLWAALAAAPTADPFLRHALIHAAHRSLRGAELRRALSHDSPRVRAAALLLLDQPPRGGAPVGAAVGFAASEDEELRRIASIVVRRHPEWAGRAAELLRGWLLDDTLDEGRLAALREWVLAFQSDAGIQALVAEVLRGGGLSTARRVLLLRTLADTNLAEVPDSWAEALGESLDSTDEAVLTEAVRTAAVLQVPRLDDRLAALAEDAKRPAPLRRDALRAVIARRRELSAGAFDSLLAQLDKSAPALDRLAAAEVIGRAQLTAAQAARATDAVRGDPLVSPAVVLPALCESASAHPEVAAPLAEYIMQSIRRGWRPAEDELSAAWPVLPPAAADELRRLLSDRDDAARAKLDAFRPLLSGGDATRGRAMFFGNKVACATCHRVDGLGGVVGPDLTKLGAIRAGGDILESVLLPSSTTAQGFDGYVVHTNDGRVLSGVIVRRSPEALVLGDSGGSDTRVLTRDVRSLRRSTVSIMPEGLEAGLTADEFRDLLAFLQGLK